MTGLRGRARIDARTQEGGPPIFDSVSSSPLDDRYDTGATPGEGTFFCLICGSQLALLETDRLPDCPRCGSSKFRRDSIFEPRQNHAEVTSEFPAPSPTTPPSWLQEAREVQTAPGYCLARLDAGGEINAFQIERGWTRIGRSLTANLRLDDPTVSRRHALVVAEPGKELRVLDDRSLNGVFVNGEVVEWAPLRDGDQLAIGRFNLYVLEH